MKLGQETKRDLGKRPQNLGVDSVTFYKIEKCKKKPAAILQAASQTAYAKQQPEE